MDWVGHHFGNYRLLRLLGEGGYAQVYLGEHVLLNAQAAIKILNTQLSDREVQRFCNEASAISRLRHPHIVRVLEFDVAEGVPFLVMEYAPRGTLRQRHSPGEQLSLKTILSYVRQVAAALQYAHGLGLIHRDVKPENLLVGGHDQILLSDFGVVVLARTSGSQSQQEAVGTVVYMAPEQSLGKPRPASDQYALGVMVYEWLTGEPPFEGLPIQIVTQHILRPPPPLHDKVPTISPAVEAVVLRALAKEPKHRFASVQAFAAALEEASRSEQTIGVSTAVTVGLASAVARTTTQPSLAALATEALTGTTTAPFSLSTAAPASSAPSPSSPDAVPPQPLTPAPRRFSRRTVLTGLGLTGLAVAGGALSVSILSSRANSPALAPRSTPPPPGTLLVVYEGHMPTAQNPAPPGPFFGVTAITWSPDGKRIASVGEQNVQVWDATTGRTLLIYSDHPSSPTDVAWSPDGTRIASASAVHAVLVWDPATGRRVFTYHGTEVIESLLSVSWSPDSTHLVSGSDAGVFVWDASNGNTSALIAPVPGSQGGNSSWDASWARNGRYIAGVQNVLPYTDTDPVTGTVQLWGATTGHSVWAHQFSSVTVGRVNWSPDSTQIAFATAKWQQGFNAGGAGQILDAATGRMLFSSSGGASSLCWSPDGTRIAALLSGGYFQNSSGGWQLAYSTAQVWDANTRRNLLPYHSFGDVTALAWSSDSTKIASGGLEGQIRVWQAK